MIDPGLNNKVALITGGNTIFGIGAAIARLATLDAQHWRWIHDLAS